MHFVVLGTENFWICVFSSFFVEFTGFLYLSSKRTPILTFISNLFKLIHKKKLFDIQYYSFCIKISQFIEKNGIIISSIGCWEWHYSYGNTLNIELWIKHRSTGNSILTNLDLKVISQSITLTQDLVLPIWKAYPRYMKTYEWLWSNMKAYECT